MSGYLLTGLTVMTILFLYVTVRSLTVLRRVRREDWNDVARDLNGNSLYRRLPLLDVLDEQGVGIVVRTDGSLAAGFRLPGLDSYYADPPALNDGSYRKEGLFRKIPVDPNLKVSYFYRVRHDVASTLEEFHAHATPNAPPFIRFINENYRRFLDENNTQRKFRRVELLCLVQYRFDDPWESGGFFLGLRKLWEHLLTLGVARLPQALAAAQPYLRKKAIVARSRAEHETKMAEFRTLLEGFRQALSQVYDTEYAPVAPLAQAEVERILFESLNPGRRFTDYHDFAGEHPTDKFYHTDWFDNRKYVLLFNPKDEKAVRDFLRWCGVRRKPRADREVSRKGRRRKPPGTLTSTQHSIRLHSD